MHHVIRDGGSGRQAFVLSHGTRQAQEQQTHEKRIAVPVLGCGPGQDLCVVREAGDVVRQAEASLLGSKSDPLVRVPVSQVVLLKAIACGSWGTGMGEPELHRQAAPHTRSA